MMPSPKLNNKKKRIVNALIKNINAFLLNLFWQMNIFFLDNLTIYQKCTNLNQAI